MDVLNKEHDISANMLGDFRRAIYHVEEGDLAKFLSGLFSPIMSSHLVKQRGVLEILEFMPSDAPVSEIKAKNKAAVAVVSKAKGFDGILFEGTLYEKPGHSLRVAKWADIEVSFG